MTRQTVIIVDDHPLAREGLAAVLTRKTALDIVGAAPDAATAVDLCRALKPDLVLLDIRLGSGPDGLQAAREIRIVSPQSRILMLTMHDTGDYVRAAVEAGATGYVLKDARVEDLIAAIEQVSAGRPVFPMDLVAQALSGPRSSCETDAALLARLTAREREILDLVASGATNKAIARSLGISPGTVKVHVERLIGKLGVSDRTQAAVLATRAVRS